MTRLLTTVIAIVLAILVALSVVIWRMPASVALSFVPENSRKWVQLHRIEGTLWNGRALLSSPQFLPAAQPISWVCRPKLGSLAIGCELAGVANGNASLALINQSVSLQKIDSQFNLRTNASAGISAESEAVRLIIPAATVSRRAVQIEGGGVASDVSWKAGPQALALGEVSLDCKPAAANSECVLRNRGGATPLEGKLLLSPQKASGYVEIGAANAKQRINL